MPLCFRPARKLLRDVFAKRGEENQKKKKKEKGGDGAHDPLMPRAPSINRDTTPTSNLPHPSPSCSPFASSTPPLQPLLTDRIDLWGRCFDPKPKGLPIPSTTHPSSSCYSTLSSQSSRGEEKARIRTFDTSSHAVGFSSFLTRA